MRKIHFLLAFLFLLPICSADIQAKQVESVTVKNVTGGKLSLKKKNVQGLQIEIVPADADNKTVAYSGYNNQIVTVIDGVITALAAGATTVDITAQDGSGVKTSIEVTVTERTPELTASGNGPDGPYLFYSDNSVKLVSVDEEGYVIEKIYPELPVDYTFTVVSHDKNSRFDVKLHPLVRPEWKRDAPKKLIVLSDPHAKWTPFISILKAQGVIDNDLTWTFEDNELTILGDVFDRGDDATTIFWLIYKLQQEAWDAGGDVTFIYGNHEEMVLRNSLSYVNAKYKNLAGLLGATYQSKYGTYYYNANTELGRWLALCNSIQIIGTDLFVHAGLGQTFYDRNYSIPDVNTIMSADIFKTSGRDSYLFSSDAATGGPLWYRGMIPGRSGALSKTTLEALLQRYQVNRVIIGHTEHNSGDGTIAYSEYDYKIVNVNVQTQEAMEENRGRGLLIENGKDSYIIFDTKPRKELQLPTSIVVPYPTHINVPIDRESKVWINNCTLNLDRTGFKKIAIYTLNGQLLHTTDNNVSSIRLPHAGLYLIKKLKN
jgi:hypothetical protein